MENLHVLTLHGEIEVSKKVRIERELDQIEHFGPGAFVIIDLTDVRYADTTFINALLRVRNRLATTQPRTSIALAAPRTSMICRLFEITKLNRVFPFFDDVAAARRSTMILLPLTIPA
jgi:anti-anti-sigma factor